MRIDQILKEKEVTISFEVFPPKTDDKYAAVEEAARQIAALRPDFMSVTYGAGGGAAAPARIRPGSRRICRTSTGHRCWRI